MKETYQDPAMTVIKFGAADVISTSSAIEPETTVWVPRENEGPPDPIAWG